jgi:hypothetical protein
LDYDPKTGLPIKSPKKPAFSQAQVDASLAANPNSTFGPSPNVNYSGLGGPVTIPGFTPDYASLIQNDPIFGQLKADLSANGIQDAAARAAAIQRGLIQFGEVPSFNGLAGLNQDWLSSDVNDTTRQLAQQNTASGMSVVARQQKQYQDNIRSIKNALAARGALRSGETGYQLGEAQRGFDTAQFDARQELLDYIMGAQQGFLAAERQRQGQLAQGAEGAFGRQTQLNPVVGSQTVYPGQPNYPTPLGESAQVAPNIASGSVGAYDNPSLSPEQRAFEAANRARKLEQDLARQGF